MKIPNSTTLAARFKKIIANPLIENIITVSGITFGIKLIAFYKETLVASTFGLSLLLDTFLIAVLIPGFIQNVFIGSLNNIFIPNYITEQNTTKKLGEFQAIVFYIVAGIMLFFTTITYFASDFFIETVFPNKSTEYYNLVHRQLLIVLPALMFMGFSSVLGGLLQIKGKFLSSSLIGTLPALITITALLFFKTYLGDLVLAYGFLVGSILPFICLLALANHQKVIHLKKPELNTNSRAMLKQLPAKLTSSILTGINPFVDKYFAVQLAVGSVAAINYGIKIPALITGLILMGLGPVILPYFSKLTNKNSIQAYHELFRMMKVLFLGALILTLILVFLSEEIVSLIFERGAFSKENSETVTLIQQILLAYIPFRVCGILMVKFLTSINKNKFMAYVSLFNLFMNIVLNLIFIKEYGLYGLVLSTTFVTILSTIIYFTYTRRLFNKAKLLES